MAAGLPCVVTESVAMSTFVEKGAGVVIKSPDHVEVSDAVMLLSEPGRFQRASEEARRIAVAHLGWGRVADLWEEALVSAIRRRTGRVDKESDHVRGW
jgi:glycosyltransferase involved in cell wall biosynthesis